MSLSVPYTQVLHFHLVFQDATNGPATWENKLNEVADKAFTILSVGGTFNLMRELRVAGREANVHCWVRTDGTIFTFTEASILITGNEWSIFDSSAKALFSAIWRRKIEAAQRVNFD